MASVPSIPRYERIAATLLALSYLGPGMVLHLHDRIPTIVPGLFINVRRLVTAVLARSSTPAQLVSHGIWGIFCGLILCTLVVMLQAVLRACGRAGFLRGISMWYWAAVHALALIATTLVFEGLTIGPGYYLHFRPLLFSLLPALLLAAWVLMRTPGEKARTTT